MKPIFRVVEICKAYDFMFGEGKGWIYVSNEIYDYKEALEFAIQHDKELPWNKTWVELVGMNDEYFNW